MPDQITYVEHAADVIKQACDLHAGGQRFALITSVAIEGGAARQVGSLALVDADSNMVGYLSNGCIDRDIQLRAGMALDDGKSCLVHYGEGSRYVDLKLPCGGALKVLIDPNPDPVALQAARSSLADRVPATLHFQLPADAAEGAVDIAFRYMPRRRLVLAGRGAVFRATAQAARVAGFEVGVLSPDMPDLEAVSALCALPPVHLISPDVLPDMASLDAHSAFLTLFHDHDWEPQVLRAALSTDVAFIGCLGSVKTQAQRRATLMSMGISKNDLSRVHGPIGLVGSLREAQLIAVSALSEVIANLPAGIETVRQPVPSI